MPLNLFPARVPIGKAAARDGTSMEVLMTVEFARALTGLLERVGGPDGVSNTELSKMIKELQQQALLLAQQLADLFELTQSLQVLVDDAAIEQAATPEPLAFISNLAERMDDEALQAALTRQPDLSQQLADVALMLALHEEPPPVQKNTVTGAKGGNAALTSLLAALAKSGIITDLTT